MPGDPLWWDPFAHRHHPCDCPPVPQVVTVTVTDHEGNVRAVREGQFLVRQHRWHQRPREM